MKIFKINEVTKDIFLFHSIILIPFIIIIELAFNTYYILQNFIIFNIIQVCIISSLVVLFFNIYYLLSLILYIKLIYNIIPKINPFMKKCLQIDKVIRKEYTVTEIVYLTFVRIYRTIIIFGTFSIVSFILKLILI